jgi:uroporphyrinogen decarboxylase
MNSRQRLITSLQHKEPDRIPLDLDSMAASGIAGMAYNSLVNHLDIPSTETRLWDPYQLLAIPESHLLRHFHIDTLPVRLPIPGMNPNNPRWKSWNLPDGSSAFIPEGFNPQKNTHGDWFLVDAVGNQTHKLPKDGFYFDQTFIPLANAETPSDIKSFPFVYLNKQDCKLIASHAKHLYESSDKGIVCRFRGSILEVACELRGWENFMVDLAINQKMAHALMQKILDSYLEILPYYLELIAPYSQVIVLGDDLGDQQNTLFSPQMYKQMIKPYHQQLVQTIKSNSDLFVFFHSDGNIRTLIPDLIEIGIDIINPVQVSANQMNPKELKKQFGKDIVFWGASVDSQHTLPFAKQQQVSAQVRELIDIFAPGGGYVFAPIHNIQAKVPPENIVAMYETAYQYGKYL